jgi:hypothetical protein
LIGCYIWHEIYFERATCFMWPEIYFEQHALWILVVICSHFASRGNYRVNTRTNIKRLPIMGIPDSIKAYCFYIIFVLIEIKPSHRIHLGQIPDPRFRKSNMDLAKMCFWIRKAGGSAGRKQFIGCCSEIFLCFSVDVSMVKHESKHSWIIKA